MQRFLIFFCAGMFTITACLADRGAETKMVPSREIALQIAHKAFAESNRGQLKKFRISDSRVAARDGEWRFFAEGVDEYARPGYHATIIVNRKTGKATVYMGE